MILTNVKVKDKEHLKLRCLVKVGPDARLSVGTDLWLGPTQTTDRSAHQSCRLMPSAAAQKQKQASKHEH